MIKFAPLPTTFPKLGLALVRIGHGEAEARPADSRSLAEQLRVAYQQARPNGYRDLTLREWRLLPYAYWEGGRECLLEVEPALVQRYWSEVLPANLAGRARTATRWLFPLWQTCLWAFDTQLRSYRKFAAQVAEQLARAVGPLAETLRDLQQRHDVFEPRGLPQRLASDLLAASGSLESALLHWRTDGDLVKTPLGREVFAAMLRAGPSVLGSEPAVDKVLRWAFMSGVVPHRSEQRVPFADGLLLPWEDHRRAVPNSLRDKLLDTFTRTDSYGDPRWEGKAGYQWQGVSHVAVSVAKRWLAGRSLEVFVDALKLTADETWAYREKFWMAYHRQGCIDEAWLVLGSLAQTKLGVLRLGKGFKHAQLQGDYMGTRSVLLLQIGQLTFVEWSHDGALRAYNSNDSKAPRLYDSSYERSELTNDGSLWMHDITAENVHPHLFHHRSDAGTWQRKARDFIRKQTGIHLHDSEIL